jgi:type I restriction enzyme R subunit
MNTMTEDTLVQQTTADYLVEQLHWDESVYGMNEVLGKEGTLGRDSKKKCTTRRTAH